MDNFSKDMPSVDDLKNMVIYCDDDLLIINKPSGVLSIQDGYNPTLPHIAKLFEPVYGKIWIIHRLDRLTSGLMILGRNANAHRSLNSQFLTRTIKKVYHAIIATLPNWEELILNIPIRINADRLHRTRLDMEEGKPSLTIFKVLRSLPEGILIECVIHTGYTHQIRAHLFHLKLPIIGETLYCKKNDKKVSTRSIESLQLYLHARHISFTHPRTGETLSMTADYPPHFIAKFN